MATASLPMYDLPEVASAHDAVWRWLADALAGLERVPRTLTRGRALAELWDDPELLLSQACGYDVTHGHADRLRVVATPCYGAPGCQGPTYASVVVVGATAPVRTLGELRGGVCAINGAGSHSGMNALRALIAPLAHHGRFFGRVVVSGGHANSLAMVAAGEADVAAIDCVTFALLQRHRPAATAGVRVLCTSARAPALPYVTRADADAATVAALQEALVAAARAPELTAARQALLLDDIVVLDADGYRPIRRFAEIAAVAGYPELA